jgi:O-acetyl-ADP-ribose deacetylase (regulator of RNase III)
VGDAKLTGGYVLPCRKIIHAVAPDSRKPAERSNRDALLASCYIRSLQLAFEHDCKSIAFCCLGTGVFQFPPDQAAKTALTAVKTFLESPDGDKIERVIFCCFMESDFETYNKLLPSVSKARS